MAFSIGNTTVNQTSFTGGSSGTVTISVTIGSVLIVMVGTSATNASGAPIAVSSVTSAHLTFTKRSSNTRHDIAGSQAWQNYEIWWANCTSTLTNEVVTVAIASNASTGTIGATECKGLGNPASPWDANGTLPVKNTGDNTLAQVNGLSTNSAAPVGLWFSGAEVSLPATPPTPATFTQANLASGVGGVGNNQNFFYQQFAAAQSNATWQAAGTSSRDWIVFGDAFFGVGVPAAGLPPFDLRAH